MTTTFALFKDSEKSFLAALDEGSIAYDRLAVCSGQVMASGNFIAIAQAVVPYTALATVVVAWLRARSSRKIIITTNDNQVVHLEGYSVEEATKILAAAKHVAVIDTRKPEQSDASDSA